MKACEKLSRLIDVKSIVTLLLSLGMLYLLIFSPKTSGEVMTLFSASYGSIITYFFTKRESGSERASP